MINKPIIAILRVGPETPRGPKAPETNIPFVIEVQTTNGPEPGMFITSVKELEFEDAVYSRCDLLTGNRRGPTWSRYVVGGPQTIPEQGREIWYRWTQQQWDSVRLIGDVIAGREPGRTNDGQTIAFMNQGEGMQFAAVGRILYDMARERGIGTSAPAEWFHQDKKYIP